VIHYLWASAQRSSASDKVLLSIQAGMAQFVATVTMQLSPIRIPSATRYTLHRLILRDLLSIWNIEDPGSVLVDTRIMDSLASTGVTGLAQFPIQQAASLFGVVFTPGAVAWLMQTVADLTLIFERLWWFVHDSIRATRAELRREQLLGMRSGTDNASITSSEGSHFELDNSDPVKKEEKEERRKARPKWWKLGFGEGKSGQIAPKTVGHTRLKLEEDDVKTIAEMYMRKVQPRVAAEIGEYIHKFEIKKAFKKDAAMAALSTIIERNRFYRGD